MSTNSIDVSPINLLTYATFAHVIPQCKLGPKVEGLKWWHAKRQQVLMV